MGKPHRCRSGEEGEIADMFNSVLLLTESEGDGEKYGRGHPLFETCREFYLDVIERDRLFLEDMSEKDFVSYFEKDFPPGFITREKERARQILDDLYAIAQSAVVRYELAPVYTFVLYHLVRDWFANYKDRQKEVGTKKAEAFLPDKIQGYLKSRDVAPHMKGVIREWVTDEDVCLADFQETYDGDFTSTDFAERIATFYLKDDWFMLQILGVEIQNFFDLLPNDLRDRCLYKYRERKETMPSHKMQESESPCVFISYSWDTERHKQWVGELANRLEQDGVRVILDQKDLALGDPMALFMEKAIESSDYVFIVCTPDYKRKADARLGGVGYEESIISSDVLLHQNHRKYIPILAAGSWETAVPLWARGKYGMDLSRWPNDPAGYSEILAGLKKPVELQR